MLALADEIGVLLVVAEVILSFMLGVHLIKSRFWAFLNAGGYTADEAEQRNINIATSIQEAFLFLFAGLFLMLPGLITDGIGLAILLPFARRFVDAVMTRSGAMDYTQRKVFDENIFGKTRKRDDHSYTSRSQTTIIETDFYEVNPASGERKDNDRKK